MLWGLALSTRALGRKPRAPWLLDLHRFLGGLSVVFVLVHMTALWADSYVQFSVTQLLVPFAATWKPLPVAWGIVAFYLLVAVELTSLVMKRLPKRFWKGVHFSSYAMYLFATVHLLTAGTDSRRAGTAVERDRHDRRRGVLHRVPGHRSRSSRAASPRRSELEPTRPRRPCRRWPRPVVELGHDGRVYQNVIVPNDGTLEGRSALAPAADLAWRCGARVVNVSNTEVSDKSSKAAVKGHAMAQSAADVEFWVDLENDLADRRARGRHVPERTRSSASRRRRRHAGCSVGARSRCRRWPSRWPPGPMPPS